MKKKVSFVYGGLVRHVYVLRIRYVKDKMKSLFVRALRGPKELIKSHELIFGPCFLIYWIGCITCELPGRILNRIHTSCSSWLYYKRYGTTRV